jgi:uncharacterized protein YggE
MRIAALLFLAASALAQGVTGPPPPPPPPELRPLNAPRYDILIVSGNASVDMAPDVVSFTLGVETEGAEVRKIVAENNAKVAAILTALKSRGVKGEELRTSGLHLSPLDRDRKDAGYSIDNEIGVTRRGVADAADLISAAIEAGANEVRGPQFSVRDEKVVQDRCIEEAFGDAKRKAVKLAALAERKLGKVLAVTDGSSSPFELQYRSPGVEGGVLGGTAVEPGVHTVSCGVTVAFGLQ